ncbi:MAG: T9SS type A sorting domain-containing protein [Salibacteraceae bacterium]
MLNNRIILLTGILFFQSLFSLGQSIYSQFGYGGTGYETAIGMHETAGGVYLAGYSDSPISGNKSAVNHGDFDYWVLKLDQSGSVVWQFTYGGSDDDKLTDFIATADGGFLLAGRSESPVSGNKTVGTYGGNDVWVVKIDSNGQVLWQDHFGTTGQELDAFVTELPNGDFIVGTSCPEGVSGNKTEPQKGTIDYWVIYLSATGTELDQFVYGGSDIEVLKDVEYFDGHVYVSGQSNSPVSSDKLQPAINGSFDFWLLKIDLQGSIQESNIFGGDNSDVFPKMNIENGSLVICGHSDSDVSGNKQSGNNGGNDYWVLKVNTNLEYVWDFSYGGDADDYFCNKVTRSLGTGVDYLMGGESNSGVSGDKTIDNFGSWDLWFVGIDEAGTVNFEFSAGGSGLEHFWDFTKDVNGGVKVLSNSWSNISGQGNKAVDTYGNSDFWTFTLNLALSIQNINQHAHLVIYPNPVVDYLNLKMDGNGAKSNISIIDLQGRTIASQKYLSYQENMIDISALPAGAYFVTIQNDNMAIKRRFIKK